MAAAAPMQPIASEPDSGSEPAAAAEALRRSAEDLALFFKGCPFYWPRASRPDCEAICRGRLDLSPDPDGPAAAAAAADPDSGSPATGSGSQLPRGSFLFRPSANAPYAAVLTLLASKPDQPVLINHVLLRLDEQTNELSFGDEMHQLAEFKWKLWKDFVHDAQQTGIVAKGIVNPQALADAANCENAGDDADRKLLPNAIELELEDEDDDKADRPGALAGWTRNQLTLLTLGIMLVSFLLVSIFVWLL